MSAVDVAIVGAGPYGLSLAAHLRAAGRELPPVRAADAAVAERPCRAGCSSSRRASPPTCPIPSGSHTLEAFCQTTGRPYASYGLPVPLDNFISYGQWFADGWCPRLEEILVTDMVRAAAAASS